MWGPISQEEADSERTWNVCTVTPLASGAIQMGVRSLQSGRSGSPLQPLSGKSCPLLP